jgi:Alginate lyase
MRRAMSFLLTIALLPVLAVVSPSSSAASVARSERDVVPHLGYATFEHPGVLESGSQLDLARAKVRAGKEPWKSAYAQMRRSSYASLTWITYPRADVDCGSRSVPDHGCRDETNAAMGAYTDALIWYVGGDHRYAAKAIQHMDRWARVIRTHTNKNARLQTGWAGDMWARAAEIMRYSGAGWSSASIQRVAGMLRTVYLPTLLKGALTANGNWELIMTDAAIGISVFNNDHTSFDRAIALWRRRVPAYFYLTSDGPLPDSPGGAIRGRAAIVKYWQGQSRFVNGLSQETCRDFVHAGWGLDAATHTAETARIQGVDLYGEERDRLTKAMEFHAKYQNGAKVPAWLCGGKLNLGLGDVLEVGYNEYHNRLGIPLPQSKILIDRSRPSGADYFLAWESLTHAAGRLLLP